MPRKADAENANDIVEYQHDGKKHWAARGSRAYQDHKERRSPAEAVPSATTVEVPKAAETVKG
ncbi:hypothetical protein [Prescottella equi]|uniref:hypothetical protein n=1 Tax=Rhodococcus hoagii TaxID=43767 RepID=UPI000A111BD4|nr:hypothetical protein [Prescottella equi]NKS12586.1 hypothetical protein [Prescottella equi]NKS17316.1 hypothetical protein [Prescottella equi]NKT05184.1 hypothetical protein [Prescottella equi]ORJ99869.1 hypothetical protein A6F58_00745 [Prescottella equi]